MIKNGLLCFQILILLSFNSCIVSKTLMLDRDPPDNVWNPDFETGLIFKTDKPKGALIRHGPQVTIREFLTREIVYNEEVSWNSYTSISLESGKYIINFYVKYLGQHIWTYKGFFIVDESAPTHLSLETPLLVISAPKVIIR